MIPLFQVAMSEHARTMVAEVLTPKSDGSLYIGEGPLCARFENEIAVTLGHERMLFVNSGTSALKLAIYLAGGRSGTEVISTPQTCLLTNTAILETGARIVWADIDPVTGNIDPNDVLRKITSKTVAVMAVDWAGRVCDFGVLRKFTRGISLIEDAAHAFGAKGPGHGDFICYSFQAIKHLTTGDGGGIVCPSLALHERGRLLRWAGLDRTRGDSMRCYQRISEAGFKMQSNDIAAAIGLANVTGAIDRVNRCRANAREYQQQLASVSNVKLPPPDDSASWWFFPIRVSKPIVFEAFMAAEGIAVGQVHARNDINPCFNDAVKGELPGAEEFSMHQTNIPCGWFIDKDQLDKIVRAVKKWSVTDDARW